eukprot:TRINITY_DN7359_c0_g1_i2.p1 TRINITY_DN7359_c0_g1~~TRINITY_DN7359_c0_g1_i2.p1  ORF type:complete len:973 (+),score=262.63 TRINITY_DN7359_c0_g1_i2:95-3013(+)
MSGKPKNQFWKRKFHKRKKKDVEEDYDETPKKRLKKSASNTPSKYTSLETTGGKDEEEDSSYEDDAKKPTKGTRKRHINVQMISEQLICAEISFKKDLKILHDTFKSIPGSDFIGENNIWTFPFTQYKSLVDKIKLFSEYDVKEIPKEVLAVFKKPNKPDSVDTDFSGIPPALLDHMLPFQLNGVAFALQHEGKCIIGDEMGLGKTVQAVAIACCYSADWPVLVICPSGLRLNWQKEFSRWIPELVRNGSGWSKLNIVNSAADLRGSINIVSYDLLSKLLDAITARNYGMIIADESHYFKNAEAQRTQAILPLLQKARRSVLLSGTASVSRPSELYTQLSAIGKGIFKSFRKFGLRYCNAFQGRFGWDYTGHSNLAELHAILHKTAMVRRLKKDVLKELPAKTRKQVFLDLSEEEKVAFKDGKKELSEAKQDQQSLMMALWTLTGKIKVQAVCRYLKEFSKEGTKFLVFAHHMEVLNGIEEMFVREKIGFIRIDGQTKSEERHRLVTDFENSDGSSLQAAILSITAAGTGLTLNRAQTVIFAELHWTPGALIQAEDRAHRIGKTSEVEVQYLLTKGTTDETIWAMIEKKLDVVGNLLNGQADQMIDDDENSRYGSLLELIKERSKRLPQQIEEAPPPVPSKKAVKPTAKKEPKTPKTPKTPQTPVIILDDVIDLEEEEEVANEDFVDRHSKSASSKVAKGTKPKSSSKGNRISPLKDEETSTKENKKVSPNATISAFFARANAKEVKNAATSSKETSTPPKVDESDNASNKKGTAKEPEKKEPAKATSTPLGSFLKRSITPPKMSSPAEKFGTPEITSTSEPKKFASPLVVSKAASTPLASSKAPPSENAVSKISSLEKPESSKEPPASSKPPLSSSKLAVKAIPLASSSTKLENISRFFAKKPAIIAPQPSKEPSPSKDPSSKSPSPAKNGPPGYSPKKSEFGFSDGDESDEEVIQSSEEEEVSSDEMELL